MVSAPPIPQGTVDSESTVSRGIEQLPTEDVPRERIDQLLDISKNF